MTLSQDQTILFIILVLIALVVLVYIRQRTRGGDSGIAKKAAGIYSFALEQTVRKNANKEKIMELFKERPELTNADIREKLGVTERSVVRYMDELEKSGKVEQVGDSGRGVFYRLK